MMIRSRRLALVAIVFAFGISACGDPSTTAPLAGKPKVIQLAAGAARDATEMAPAAATGGVADSKIAAMAPTEFVYDGELPALADSAASWYFAPGQQPDLDRIAKLAAAFGIKGDVRTLPTDQGGGWAVGPEDYSSSVLTVGSDGMLSWWLSGTPSAVSVGCAVSATTPAIGSDDAATSGVATDVAVPAGPGPDAMPPGTVPVADVPVPECPAPKPPAGVPTKEEALAKAKDLVSSWGYDASSYQFDEPYADEWNASVNASLMLDGMKSPITLSVGFGENGSVTYASGSLATPQRGADYPTIGAQAGLERLKTQQNLYFGALDTGIMRASTDVVATPQPEPAVTIPASTDYPVIAPDIAPCATNMDVACGGPVSTEPVTVTLNSVKPDLTMVWATDQTVWLLPAYTFGSADGGMYTVIAVSDDFIQQPVAEPGTTTPVGTAVQVPSTEVAAPPTNADCLVLTGITVPSAPVDEIAKAVVGYCVTDAQKLAETFGFTVRVAREDGVDLPVTADFSESRINVAVEKGTVTEVLSIG
ncbi:MAG TPA: hypothetical protein VHN36_06030 [Ilumatobacteraceae bacterium]|nr:hypothetical protein [Ilumatobacteraceae bacterium]